MPSGEDREPTRDDFGDLRDAVARVAAGCWVVGVSGGADSVALLRLAAGQTDLRLVAAHLDHELRGEESTGDADFVGRLCGSLSIECVRRRRSEVEGITPTLPNLAARLRAARHALFASVAARLDAAGVLLAHHADDQAQTVLLRLLRGGEATALGGMRFISRLGGLTIARPLLAVRCGRLRDYLAHLRQPWREDSSNQSPLSARNRIRAWLADRPGLTERLLRTAAAAGALREWVDASSPRLPDTFATAIVAGMPSILARRSLRSWLGRIGTAARREDVDRLLACCRDLATPARLTLSNGVAVSRRRGRIAERT